MSGNLSQAQGDGRARDAEKFGIGPGPFQDLARQGAFCFYGSKEPTPGGWETLDLDMRDYKGDGNLVLSICTHPDAGKNDNPERFDIEVTHTDEADESVGMSDDEAEAADMLDDEMEKAENE